MNRRFLIQQRSADHFTRTAPQDVYGAFKRSASWMMSIKSQGLERLLNFSKSQLVQRRRQSSTLFFVGFNYLGDIDSP